MSSREIVAGLPLATGSTLISVALLNSTLLKGAFIMEWMGAFLAFYGLSYLTEPRTSIALSGAILLAGSLGDIILLGGLTPLNWTLVNYMVFVHSAAGALMGYTVKRVVYPENKKTLRG